jgi:hypothetical protein
VRGGGAAKGSASCSACGGGGVWRWEGHGVTVAPRGVVMGDREPPRRACDGGVSAVAAFSAKARCGAD